MRLRTAPLLATDRDAQLFVEPDGFRDLTAYVRAGANVLIVGQRGIGKTSALHFLERQLMHENAEHQPIFVDLASTADAAQALNAIYVAATGRRTLDFNDAALAITGQPLIERRLDQLSSLRPTIILGDGLSGPVAYTLFGKLRDRLWETRHQWVFTADEKDRGDYLRSPADSFWEQVVKLRFGHHDLIEMLTRRADGPTPPWATALVDVVPDNPRELLRAAQRIEAGVETAPQVASRREHWHRAVADLPRAEAMVLAELEGLGSASASDPALLSRVGYSRASVARALRSLLEAGLVEAQQEAQGPGRPRLVYKAAFPQ